MTNDNNIYFRRPITMDVYAILTPSQVSDLRRRKRLDTWLNEQRNSGVIIQTAKERYNTTHHLKKPESRSMTARYCTQCKTNCEGNDEGIGPEIAQVYVQGTRPDYHDPNRMRPYRAYLCNDHCELELEDGANFPIQRRLTS